MHIPRINRNRLGPAKRRPVQQVEHQRHQYRPDGIDVPNRIQRQPARVGRRSITEELRYPTVRDFVNSDREDARDDPHERSLKD